MERWNWIEAKERKSWHRLYETATLGQTPQYESRWWWVSLCSVTEICWYAQACFNSLGISIFYHQMVTSSFKRRCSQLPVCDDWAMVYTLIYLPSMLLQPSTPWSSCSLALSMASLWLCFFSGAGSDLGTLRQTKQGTEQAVGGASLLRVGCVSALLCWAESVLTI